jgi:TolA-binding protein
VYLFHQRSSDGSLSHEEDLAKVIELQEVIDKQSREQSQMKERLAALSSHVAELEEDLDTARKDLIKSEEMNTKLQRDVREVSDGRGCSVGKSAVGVFGPLHFSPFCASLSQLLSSLGFLLRNSETEQCDGTYLITYKINEDCKFRPKGNVCICYRTR